jgi:SAM-dependent methyltransferase
MDKANSFEYWHYEFNLGNGIVINPTLEGQAEKKRNLKDFIWPVVLELCGGSLKGLRVLDVACNAGFWSLEAHNSGADYVLGFDMRQEYIDQAELVRDALGVDPKRVEFTQMNIYDLSRKNLGQDFDLVLLFRVLDHLSNPLSVIQRLREVTRKYLVVDVRLAVADQPFLEVVKERPADPRSGVDIGLGLRPSPAALNLMLTHCGFTDVTEVPPRQPLQEHYFDGRRSLFTCRAAV